MFLKMLFAMPVTHVTQCVYLIHGNQHSEKMAQKIDLFKAQKTEKLS